MFKNTSKKSSMESEIFEQPEILANIIDEYVKEDFIALEVPDDIKKIVIVASGSSYNCARYAADLFGNIADIEAHAMYSSEFLLKTTVPSESNILYMFITQSGETSDTNKALNRAKQLGVMTLCITNKKDSSIWQASDYKVDCLAGEEKSIAATKSLMSQMICCLLVVLKYAKLKGVDVSHYIENVRKLPEAVSVGLGLRESIKKLAKDFAKHKNIVVTADGISYAIAREACLKIKETSYINVSTSILGEFMHGHLAILNNKSMMIYIAVEQISYTAIKNMNKIISDYKTPICIIGETNSQIETNCQLKVQFESDIVRSFAITAIIQLLSLEIATILRRNVDKPHGLHKVVK